MKSLTTSLKDIGFLTIALTLALAANFAYGQWSNPSTAAPGGNVDEPINVGSGNQYKVGAFTAWDVKAAGKMWSPQYCDGAGLNCLTHAQLVAAVTGAPAPAPGPADCAASGSLPAGEHLQLESIETCTDSDVPWVPPTCTTANYQCLDGTWNGV